MIEGLTVDAGWMPVVWSLLIGLLVGAQREAAHKGSDSGVRDFLVIALTGCVCGLAQAPWLAVAALLAMSALHVAYLVTGGKSGGVTTEFAAVAVFCLTYLSSVPETQLKPHLAAMLAVILTGVLEAKRTLHKLFRETVTEQEINDTIRFLALIFVIYPVLPEGEYGPFGFFNPRRVWMFVILVSSISYIGYFLEKFLGASRGLLLTGMVSGLSSTTAATTAFAKDSRAQPERLKEFWQAATISNAVQFPRVLALLAATSPVLAGAMAKPLLAMAGAGLAVALLIHARHREGAPDGDVALRNPLNILPALKFGLIFVAIVFVSRAVPHYLGTEAIRWTALVSGLVDVDAITVSLGEMTGESRLDAGLAGVSLLLALTSNAVVKIVIAQVAGGMGFAARMAMSMGAMLAAGGLTLLLLR